MKKTAIYTLVVAFVFMATASITFAAKPDNNKAGAQKVDWNLSADVMPVPPYGSGDIEGSDTASKLIVNQPNGKVDANITGVMNGLNPDTTYTVYLSKEYTEYIPLDMRGTYEWLVLGTYLHDMVIDIQNPDGTFSGTGGYPAGSFPYNMPGQTAETITGQVIGNQITFTTTYTGPYNPGYTATVSGTINPNGSMTGASPWEWHTTIGSATLASGSTGWSGLLTSEIQPFTFTTNSEGSGSWHINVKEGVTTADEFSVWINGGGKTILVSDSVSL